MDEFFVSKQSLLELINLPDDLQIQKMQEIYELCLQDKVQAHNHHEMVALLILLLIYKQNQFAAKAFPAQFFFDLKNIKDNTEVLQYYHLLERTNLEIALTISFENDPVGEKEKVDFAITYASFYISFFRPLKCITVCNNALFRDQSNSTANFFKASLLDICKIVKHDPWYNLALNIYQKQMLSFVCAKDVKFDALLVPFVINKMTSPIRFDWLSTKLFGLFEIPKDFLETDVGQKCWDREKDFYLRNTLFLNPLNNFGMFAQASLEELQPLNISKECTDLFDSIIEDFKFCRRKVFEFVGQKTLTSREMCAIYSFMYSIYDKVAYLLAKTYDLDIEEKDISFTEQGLFSRKLKSSGICFQDIRNPAIIPLYFEFLEARRKNIRKSPINPGTFELNEFRNFIEHRSTLLVDEDRLIRNSKLLIQRIRNLIIETYILLISAKSNLESDDIICAGTAYARGLFEYNNAVQTMGEIQL